MKKNSFLEFLFCLLAVVITLREARAASGVTADVSSLSFGDQAEGTASDPQTVTLTHGPGGDGVVWTIAVAGLDPEQFFISEDNCSVTVLAGGESCTLSIVYLPNAVFADGIGPAQALLQIPFNDATDNISIDLSGNSVAPNIQSSVLSLDYGSQVAGQLSDPQDITITNTGQADLVLANSKIIGENSADFVVSMDLCSFETLSPGASCQIELEMRPTELGDRAAQLALENNDPDEPLLTVELTGKGTGSGGCSLGGAAPGISWLAIPLLLAALALGRRFLRE